MDSQQHIVGHSRLVSALDNLPGFGIVFFQDEDASFLRETLANVIQPDEKLKIFTVSKEQSYTFDANLKQPAFSGSQILNGEFTTELHPRKSTSTSRSRSFHRFFDAVVQRFALFGVVLMQLSLTAVASPQAEDFGFGAVGHVDDAFEPPAFDDGPADGPQDQTVFAYLKKGRSPLASVPT